LIAEAICPPKKIHDYLIVNVEFSGWYVFHTGRHTERMPPPANSFRIFTFSKSEPGLKPPGVSAGYRHTRTPCQTKKFIIFGFFSGTPNSGIKDAVFSRVPERVRRRY